MLLLVFKCVHGNAPTYLADFIHPYNTSRHTRLSNDPYLLAVPKSNLKTYGDISFSVAGPQAWNKLPIDLRLPMSLESFKKKLKTYLFDRR